MLYVGGGIINAGAEAELLALAEETRIPVVTTLMAKGAFPDSHALSLQMPGMHGSKFANWALHRSDLLITVGARFDDRVTGKLDAFAPGAKVIHMDIDPAEISKNRHADVPIVGELREVLPQLTKAIAKLRESDSIMNHRAWLEQVEEWKFKYPYRYRRAGALKPEYVIERLRDLLAERDTIWTTGVGQHQMWAAQWLHIDGSRRFITSGGLGTMGFGFPAALGAKLGRPEATVVCIDGDGCFQMTLQELATAVVYDIPVIVAVMNNGWLGMVRQWQELFHDERFSQTHLNAEIPDYVKLAEAFGAVGFRAENEAEVDVAILAALESGRPAVIDFRVDHEEKVYPMVPAGAALGRHDRRRLDRGRQLLGGGGGLMARSDNAHHTLSVLVENTPGVLTRVSSLFARRAFNIESLAVGPTERPDRSCITIRVDCSDVSIDQVVKQLYKLVNVLKVNQMTTADAIERELMLVKVTASPDKRGELIHLAEVYGARVSDVGAQALVFEIVEHPDKLASFEELLRPYGIKETIRTGRIAMRRALGERRDRDAARMRVLA